MVTLKELARLLNVSVSTVSKALSDSSEIGEDTKKRVVELANELNYKPNRIAQQLKSNKTNVIGVIVPSLTNPFFAEVLHGIETTIEEKGYDMIVCISNESIQKEQRSLELLANGSVDGFIIAVGRESQAKEQFQHFEDVLNLKPLVMFDRVINEIDCGKVIVNDFQSLYEATKYLIAKEQRQHILLISNIEELSVGKHRTSGYSQAIAEAKLQSNILELGNVNNPKETILKYLEKNTHIDAIVSIDHITGIMALNKVKQLGKAVPTDVSIIGFGYSETEFLSSPRLSVIDQKGFLIGKTAVKLLMEDFTAKKRIPKTVVIDSELHLNQTTL